MDRAPDVKKNPDTQTAAPQAAAAPALLSSPIVLKRAKSKKRKKKYSRGTKGMQRLLLGVSRAGYRTSNSLSEGLDTFVKRSKKAGRKKRDGMLRDAFRNMSRGVSDGVTEFGKAPNEITKRVSVGRGWRIVRVLSPFRN